MESATVTAYLAKCMIRWSRMAKGVGFMSNNCNIELIQVVDFVTDA